MVDNDLFSSIIIYVYNNIFLSTVKLSKNVFMVGRSAGGIRVILAWLFYRSV